MLKKALLKSLQNLFLHSIVLIMASRNQLECLHKLELWKSEQCIRIFMGFWSLNLALTNALNESKLTSERMSAEEPKVLSCSMKPP